MPSERFCAPLYELLDWAATVPDEESDRSLMHMFSYFLVPICLRMGDGDISLQVGRDEAAIVLPYLEAGSVEYAAKVDSGEWPA